MSEEEYFDDEEEIVHEAEVPILTVSPGDNEKGSVFRDFLNMRNEASFCDVAFLVQGTLFRAHRVVVSSWSRWLFALLSEGPDQEIVSLDVFSPHEFGAVLDYMYGEPLEFTLANAEHMLKIVRRLELRVVEQKCWRFLLSIVNHENCVHLHQIADFFECAPLKISAWRIIQESKPGYSSAPNHMMSSMQVNANSANMQRGHGLTGPGEMNATSHHSQGHDDDDDSDDDDDVAFSIFSTTTPTGLTGEDEESHVPNDEGLLGSINKRYDHYVHPDKLPKGAPAAQVVKAWSFRLQEVFSECCNHTGDLSIAEHAGMSALASNRSETESVSHSVQQEEVQRQFSAFSDVSSVADRTAASHSNQTPILSQPRPLMAAVSHSQRTPREEKQPAAVKFSNVREQDESSTGGGRNEHENRRNFSNTLPPPWTGG